MSRLACLSAVVVVWTVTGCSSDSAPNRPPASALTRLPSDHLPNLVQVHERVLSGGLPEGDAAFQELVRRGVRTMISVDGAKPDVERARKFGLRYIHLPHGYDGIPNERAQELAKAVRVLDGPIYIHCQHGKHRSPAAASVACVTAGLLPTNQAISILTLAGTNPKYRGLYQSARNATPLESALLDELQLEFHETVQVPPLAESMVQLGHTYDHLQLLSRAAWKPLADHPDLDPAHKALILREHFTELLRTEEVRKQPVDFQQWLSDSESAAKTLENVLSDETPVTDQQKSEHVTALVARIAGNCKSCHSKYRDVPVDERG